MTYSNGSVRFNKWWFSFQLLVTFLVLGVASTNAMAPPLATLLQKRRLAQDQDKTPVATISQVESGSNQGINITSGSNPTEVANEEESGTTGQGSKTGVRTQETQQQEEEKEEPAGAESKQQFSVVALQDLDTAATGELSTIIFISLLSLQYFSK